MTAQVGPTPSTRGPLVIFTACPLWAGLPVCKAEALNAIANAIIENSFIFIVQYPSKKDQNS
jgi:hypothetical protein